MLLNLFRKYTWSFLIKWWSWKTRLWRPAILLKKRPWCRCFPVNFAKFVRTPFLKEHLGWLLLEETDINSFDLVVVNENPDWLRIANFSSWISNCLGYWILLTFLVELVIFWKANFCVMLVCGLSSLGIIFSKLVGFRP